MPGIEIFKPTGTLTSMEGVQVSLTAADLQDIATAYNPAVHEAPLTIGHPTHDAPAYGWVKSLSFADGALHADCEQSAELGQLVANGHYKKVSASFYLPRAPGNPTPGKFALRHVGFLGAQPPGVKGLKAVSFADGEEGVVTFGELPGYAGSAIARLFGRMRDWLIEKEGQEVADRVLSSWEVDSIRQISQRAEEAPLDAASPFSGGSSALSFSEPGYTATLLQPAAPANQEKPPMKTPEQLQAELDAANATLQTLRAAETARLASDRAAAAATRHSAHVSFAEGLVKASKWPQDSAAVLVQALDVLAMPGEATGVVSFGEGDAAKPLVVVLQEKLQTLPESVSFAEFARDGAAAGGKLSDREVANRAAAYVARLQKAGQTVGMSAAIDAVLAGTDNA